MIIDFELVKMEAGNRMIRVGFGKNANRWFVRIDMWWYGFRVAEKAQ